MGGAQVFRKCGTWGELHKLLDDLFLDYEVTLGLHLESLYVAWNSNDSVYNVAVRFRK